MSPSALKELYGPDEIRDETYLDKTRILNEAIAEIGWGRYQVYLFLCAGFGWFAFVFDRLQPVLNSITRAETAFGPFVSFSLDDVRLSTKLITGLILSPVVTEFNFNGPFLSLAANAGLLVGAIFWGVGSDIWGRRWSFNLTLLIAGVFGVAAGGSSNFLQLASLLACVGVGVGGNLPVDSAVFLGTRSSMFNAFQSHVLDLVPARNQYMLTVLSVWWSLGQLLISLLAWPLIANFTCSELLCPARDNMGWRYLLFTLGALTLVFCAVRVCIFNLLESPRFLIGIGKDQQAVEVVHRLAAYNSTTTNLRIDDLNAVEEKQTRDRPINGNIYLLTHSTMGRLTSRGAKFGDGSLYITYRNQVILSAIGVPGAILAGWAVQLPFLGRKGTFSVSCGKSRPIQPFFLLKSGWMLGLTGVFLFATTTARSSVQLLGWNCGYVFFSNIMYGVLYAMSPELFPAKDRGTGNALVSTSTRVFGVLAPVIALYADVSTAVPVYVSGSILICMGMVAWLLPFDAQGHQSM
ncbi:MFS domain-containing protein [Mycena indigotica]|uniref:MFS domain-containing protein n=1 Tax=Mycena indigotica TaxID=2126181 RepID=A0A8H6T3J2_9AGAR|nr:MFS domain-containing protein [Mycena indigotica]KAF7309596.1 MFS domain-containing protein [Mycena indigotica]